MSYKINNNMCVLTLLKQLNRSARRNNILFWLIFVVGVWWVLAVGCGKGLALHSGYNPPHLVWPNYGWLWHHNSTTKLATFLVGLSCKCGGGYHNVPKVGPHPRHTSTTHRPHIVVEVWRDQINRIWAPIYA